LSEKENLRFHAAGHISAARDIVCTVKAYAEAQNVNAPPAVLEQLSEAADILERLEGWFVDPLNATIEASNG
jgi:hypothetical protein